MPDSNEPPKRDPASGSPTARQYARYESKFMMATMVGLAIIFTAIPLFFVLVIVPGKKNKYDRMQADLTVIARAAKLYAAEHQCFPDSFQQLDVFATNSSNFEIGGLPSKDPWKQDYAYYKMSEDRAAVVSGGRNGRLDTRHATFMAPSEENIRETDNDGVYSFMTFETDDDWIYLVGSWPVKAEEPGEKTLGDWGA